jgi:lysophospholipase L1-like esterase
MIGKTVINAGKGGEKSSGGAARAASVLRQHKPAAMTILYGANDLTAGASTEETITSLRSIINVCRENQTEPVLATLTPMVAGHELWAGGVVMLNEHIRALASSAGVRLVDLEREFGSDPSMLLLPDGLHPTTAGNQVIADAFAGAL